MKNCQNPSNVHNILVDTSILVCGKFWSGKMANLANRKPFTNFYLPIIYQF